MRYVIRLFLKDQYKDKTLMEDLITESSIKWEIIKPGMLSNGKLTKTYKILPRLQNKMKVGKISRANVAHFLINQAENPEMLYQHVALTN